MNTPERIRNVLNFKPADRMPRLEWGPWWNKTLARWRTEGLDPALRHLRWVEPGMPLFPAEGEGEVGDALGLDPFRVLWLAVEKPGCPAPPSEGAGIISDAAGYRALRPHLFPEEPFDPAYLADLYRAREAGEDLAVWLWVDGFFWTPRKLLGIEPHLFAFYDQPELLEEINADLLAYYRRVLPRLFEFFVPDLLLVAEDLSYNHGPMLSKESFDRILAPFYRPLTELLRGYGVRPFMDSDGDITPIIPWLREVGVEGLGPLERMAGVDLNRIRRDYPDFLLLGGFDKTTMSQGEAAMRAEFERLLPVIASGGYLPTVDHQTPPEVSLENYRLFRRLFREYTDRALAR